MEEIGIDLKLSVSFHHLPHGQSWRQQDPSIQQPASEKQELLKSLPAGDEELYSTWRRLEAHQEFLTIQEVSYLVRTHYRADSRRSTLGMKPRTCVESSWGLKRKSNVSSLSLWSSVNSSKQLTRREVSSDPPLVSCHMSQQH